MKDHGSRQSSPKALAERHCKRLVGSFDIQKRPIECFVEVRLRKPELDAQTHDFEYLGERIGFLPLYVPKTLSELMERWNRPNWRNDRAALFHSGRPGFAIQVEVAA